MTDKKPQLTLTLTREDGTELRPEDIPIGELAKLLDALDRALAPEGQERSGLSLVSITNPEEKLP